MTTYSTQNPLGSSDPRDLYDNAQNFDEAVNSEGTTFNDRTGKSRLTLKGMEQVFDGGQPAIDAYYSAVEEADRAAAQVPLAAAEADRAEAAADAAFINADVYPDVASGLAAVADGEQFQVVEGDEIVRYRRDSASTQTEVGRYPSASAMYFPRPPLEIVGTGTDGTSQIASNYILTFPTASQKKGYVSRLKFGAPGAGVVRIYLFTPLSGDDFKVAKIIDFNVVAGNNEFAAPKDFEYFEAPVGSRIGGRVLSGGTNLYSSNATAPASSRNFLSADVNRVGDIAPLQALNGSNDIRTPSMIFTIDNPEAIISDTESRFNQLIKADSVVDQSGLIERGRPYTSHHRQYFRGTLAPEAWTLAGWTVNDGLVAPTAPGAGTHAKWDVFDNTNYGRIAARFVITDATTSKFGIYTRPEQGSWGGSAIIDAATSTLSAYTNTTFIDLGSNTATSVVKQVSIPPLVVGREYILEVLKYGWDDVFVWRDVESGTETMLRSPFSKVTHDLFRGQGGLIYLAGAAEGVKCTYFETGSFYDNPSIVLLGDSNTSGAAGIDSVFGQWRKTWSYLLDAQRGRGDVLNTARGGERASELNAMSHLNIDAWSPDFWVIAIGTNETSLAEWRNNVSAIITKCQARGGQVVLTTVPPKTSTSALVDSMNADLLSGYFGDFPLIDFALAVCSGGDRAVADASLFADGVHFNVKGHARVYERIRSDAPFLMGS